MPPNLPPLPDVGGSQPTGRDPKVGHKSTFFKVSEWVLRRSICPPRPIHDVSWEPLLCVFHCFASQTVSRQKHVT